MNLEKTQFFLENLSKNNNREWFNNNKELYNEAKKEFETFVDELIPRLKTIDSQIDVTSAKECTFRIFRDVRFSKNKLPFKTNFGAFINKGGRKSDYAGFYIHIEQDNCFIGGGIFMPQAKILKAIRTEIMYNADSLREIIKEDNFIKYFEKMQGEKLKTAPRGIAKDHKDIDLLRHKGFFVSHKLSNKLVNSKSFIAEIDNICTSMFPFNQYFNSIIDEIETHEI